MASGKGLATLQGHRKQVECLASSPGGKTPATGSWDKTIELWDTAMWKEQVTLEIGHGSGCLLNYSTAYLTPEKARRACLPVKRADRPVGEWNVMAITMKGDRITVEVNGDTVGREVRLPQSRYFGQLPAKGPIGLQKHGHGCCVEFRNMFISALEEVRE